MGFQASSGRHLPLLLSITAAALIAVLTWLTWRSLEQDRFLVSQRLQRRLDNTADQVVTDLESSISATKRKLSELGQLPNSDVSGAASLFGNEQSHGALVIIADSTTLSAFPANRLRYYPIAPAGGEHDPHMFERAELLEFSAKDYPAAIAAYRELAESRDRATRAGALLRLGRVLRKQGQLEAALDEYDQLTELDVTFVESLPVDLLARHARCAIWQQLKRSAQLQREANSLWSDLRQGRWRLTRAGYQFYERQTRQWLSLDGATPNDSSLANPEALALADGVESIWEEWLRIQRGAAPSDGYRFLRQGDVSVLLVWSSEGERLVALVTEMQLFTKPLQRLLVRQGAQWALTDANGTSIMGPWMERGTVQAVRTSAETQLPWTLQVTSNDLGAVSAEIVGRRRLLVTGLAVTIGVTIVASFAIVRSVTRELEVARLQSNFVAAVSHEFRTPLASLCQLNELLADGRVPSSERRQEYYQALRRMPRAAPCGIAHAHHPAYSKDSGVGQSVRARSGRG